MENFRSAEIRMEGRKQFTVYRILASCDNIGQVMMRRKELK